MCQYLEDSSPLKENAGVSVSELVVLGPEIIILANTIHQLCDPHNQATLPLCASITNLGNHRTFLIGAREDEIKYKQIGAASDT